MLYQLEQPTVWESAVGSGGLAWVPFVELFQVATALGKLEDLESKPAVVQRVEAAKLQPALVRLADVLGVPRPPVAGGNAAQRADLLAWGAQQVARFGHAHDFPGSTPLREVRSNQE